MTTVKIRVSNQSSKSINYHYYGTQSNLNSGDTREVTVKVGDTFYFESDNGIKSKITESDNGRTFTYNR